MTPSPLSSFSNRIWTPIARRRAPCRLPRGRILCACICFLALIAAELAAAPAAPSLKASLSSLGSKYLVDRRAAVAALSSMGHDALLPVLAAARSDDYFTRTAAMEVAANLARKGDEDLLGRLVCTARYPAVRGQAATILGRMDGATGAGYLRAGLGDRDATVREACVRSLGILGSADSAPKMRPLLKDESAPVRAAACEALGAVGDNASRGEILASINDRFPEVRLAAVAAVGKLGPLGALSAIDVAVNAKDTKLQVAALKSLGVAGGDAAAHACALVLVSSDVPEVVEAARAALAEMRGRASAALAHIVSEGDVEARARALHRVALVGRPAVPALLKILEGDPYDRLRDDAARSLEQVTGKACAYRYDLPPDKQKEAIQAWMTWWQGEGSKQ